MSLVSTDDVRALVATSLSTQDLQTIIDREEAEMVRRFGAHSDGVTPLTETQEITGADVFMSRPVLSVSGVSVVPYVGAASSALTTSQYYLVPPLNRIRIAPFLREAFVTVTYVPKDDTALRSQVLIELVRIAVEQTAMTTERIDDNGASVTVTAPNWSNAREALYARLMPVPAI